jgi:uncharacterized membrane protein
MNAIDPKEAASALSDINEMANRVRQSTIYNLASLMLIMWGALVFAGHIVAHFYPRSALLIWLAVTVLGTTGSFAISAATRARTGVSTVDGRALAAFLLFLGFGYLWTLGLGHFTPRQMDTFWPIYFMLVYTMVGLWVGVAFVAIGLGISALTLIGYFFIGDWFHVWMAVVNGGGLMLGGLWMRRS